MNIKLRPKDPGVDLTFNTIKVLLIFFLASFLSYFSMQRNWLNAGLTLAIGCVLVLLYELTWPRPIPMILITDEGINDLRMGIGAIPWSEIEDVQIIIEGGYLGLRLKRPQDFLLRLPQEQREVWAANPLGFHVLNLKTRGLHVNLIKLVPVLRAKIRSTQVSS